MADPSDLTQTKSPQGCDATANPSATRDTVEEEFSCEEGSRVGRYRLCSILGEGGFGRVFLAQDEELGRRVAVKIPHRSRIVDASDVETFLAEARVAAQLDHPRIVPVFDFGKTDDGRCFIVSKYIEGTNLAVRIRGGRIGHLEAARLLAALAEALDHAHTRRVVHRDVKPGNVLLDAAGNPFLTDFGLALREENVGSGLRFAGSVSYMSPEQARGEGHRVDGRSDVYSLCVVFYELLAGRRPFRSGDRQELLQQVISVEPQSLRQLDSAIPGALERICLKGLSKRIGDRYSTAGDLADDLRGFLAEAGVTETSGAAAMPLPAEFTASERLALASDRLIPIVPRGLRAYGPEDAEFFLDLLPGPRDRHGVPESVQFWKRRIETFDPEEAFSVGLMYGPSGCGKTSLVRAALIPRLERRVRAVYCEADAEATESRLLHRLRFTCPDLPPDLGLKESLTAIRRTPSLAPGGKLLLVLDQFEQWLHAQRSERQPELVQAMRQCDGETLACLILVRDDFWLGVSRFLRELETPLVEGHNSALIDVFDLRHARKVLVALGRALEALPPGPLDRQARAFVDEAVAGLAEDERVVCVRLSLFAEMMRGRQWTPATLRSLGGVQGIGVRFLEETFATATAPPEHRRHEKAARGVLEALLPEADSEIRGRVRSHAELLSASGYAARPAEFANLLRILDHEVRLITPVDPEGQAEAGDGAGEAADRPVDERTCYQLTHDFLVPSLRDWLRERQSRSLRGRMALCLAERARRWEANPETRQLPSCWEWLRIRCLVRPGAWTGSQQRLMKAACWYYVRRAVVAVVLIGLASFVSLEAYGRFHAEATVQRLLSAETADVPDIVQGLASYYRWAQRLLLEALDDPEPRRQLHASLGLLPVDPGQADFVQSRLLEAGPQEFLVICDALRPPGRDTIEAFLELVADATRETPTRFRAACALAAWDIADQQWREHADEIAAWLVSENSLLLGRWLEILRPAGDELVQPLKDLHQRSDRQDIRHHAMVVLAEYLQDDPQQLLELARTADRENLAVIARPLRQYRQEVADALRTELEQSFTAETSEAAKDAVARTQADAGLLLCLLGTPDAIWPYLKHSEDPRLRTSLVHGLSRAGVDPALLIDRWAVESDVSIRRAILWSLGRYETLASKPRRRNELAAELIEIHREHPDPGLHSAAEWLLRRWGYDDQVAANAVVQPPQADREWYRTSQGQTMAIVRGPVQFMMGSPLDDPTRRGNETFDERRIDWSFAIGTKEVSLREYGRFSPGHRLERDDGRSPDAPVDNVSLLDAMAYCQWLSQQEGLPDEAMCYEIGADGHLQPRPDGLTRAGYRLPTEVEWEYACRAGTTTARYFGHNVEYVRWYAWYLGNSDGSLRPGGLLLPNDLGLFDMYGNVQEWCQSPLHATPDGMYVVRGSTDQSSARIVRSAFRQGLHRISKFAHTGFRIARTIPPSIDTRQGVNDD